MTTTITKSVGSASRDYTTLAAAWAALPADLTAVDQAYIFELYNDSTFTTTSSINLNGKTLDATRNVLIRPHTGQGFRDNLNSSTPFTGSASNGVTITSGDIGASMIVTQQYVTLDGLQLISQNSGNPIVNNLGVVKNCFGRSSSGASGNGGFTASGTGKYINCFVTTGAGNAFFGNDSSEFHNCSAYASASNGNYGFRGNYSTPLYFNCSSFGYGTPFGQASNSGNDYNVSDGTSPGTHSLSNKVATNQYVSTSDYRVKAGSDLINAGTPDTTNTGGVDILNQARNSTTPTVGSYEYGVSPPVQTVLTVTGTAGNGTVGTSYSAQFTASGGTSPYTYSVGSGSLPAGISLNTTSGLVSGTPTAAGSSTFVIHAVDSGS